MQQSASGPGSVHPAYLARGAQGAATDSVAIFVFSRAVQDLFRAGHHRQVLDRSFFGTRASSSFWTAFEKATSYGLFLVRGDVEKENDLKNGTYNCSCSCFTTVRRCKE